MLAPLSTNFERNSLRFIKKNFYPCGCWLRLKGKQKHNAQSRLSQIQSGCSKRPFHFYTPYEKTKSMETLAIIFPHGNVYERYSTYTIFPMEFWTFCQKKKINQNFSNMSPSPLDYEWRGRATSGGDVHFCSKIFIDIQGWPNSLFHRPPLNLASRIEHS